VSITGHKKTKEMSKLKIINFKEENMDHKKTTETRLKYW